MEAKHMSEKWKDRLTDQLCKAFLSLNDSEETYKFLEDVATIGEIRAFAQRLEVARLLARGETYPQIARETGASTATISRVKKFLEYGADGYRLVLERISEESEESGQA
jgi:TrpR-related protein YerC/YecD